MFYAIKLYFLFGWYKLGFYEISHPTYLFYLYLNYSSQVILFFVSEDLFLFQKRFSHQINDTIDNEEEMEAWREMSDFFGEQFEIFILEIQTKYIDDKNVTETEIDSQKQRIELLERNNLDQEKKDMWDD